MLKSNKSSGWMLAAACAGVASIISWVDFGLWVSKLSSDSVGVALNAVIAVAFTLTTIGFYIQWKKVRNAPEE